MRHRSISILEIILAGMFCECKKYKIVADAVSSMVDKLYNTVLQETTGWFLMVKFVTDVGPGISHVIFVFHVSIVPQN